MGSRTLVLSLIHLVLLSLFIPIELAYKVNTRAGQKIRIRIRRTEPNLTRKSSTESEPKLIKYPNRFKILVSKEPEPNPTRTRPEPKYFGYPNVSEIDFYTTLYKYILDLMSIKNILNI